MHQLFYAGGVFLIGHSHLGRKREGTQSRAVLVWCNKNIFGLGPQFLAQSSNTIGIS